jgi:hypothetical protein
MIFSLKNDANLPSISNKQKNFEKIGSFLSRIRNTGFQTHFHGIGLKPDTNLDPGL